MAWQLPHGAKKGPMEEAFERLEAALQRLPASEHTPEMLLLAASHKEFRVAVHYAWDAMAAARGEGPPPSQDDMSRLILATVRACSLGMEGAGAYSLPNIATSALLCLLGLGAPDATDHPAVQLNFRTEELCISGPPPISSAMRALEAIATSVMLGSVRSKTMPASFYAAGAMKWLDAAIDSIWPPAESRQEAEGRMRAQSWVLMAPHSASSSSSRSRGKGGKGGRGGKGSASASSATTPENPTAAAAELAALLHRLRPNLTLQDLHQSCLVLRCTLHSYWTNAIEDGSSEHMALVKAALIDCQQLLNLQPSSMYPRHVAAGKLDSWRSYSKEAGDSGPEWRFLKGSLELAKQLKWYRAAAGLNYYVCVRMADLVQHSATSRIPHARVAGLVNTMARLMQETREYERKLQPWLPSRRLYVVTERRKQIEAKLAEFRATGRIEDSSVPSVQGQRVCDACGTAAMHLLMCAKCRAVRYCSRECQVRHWKEGGHKAACAQLAAQRTQHGAG